MKPCTSRISALISGVPAVVKPTEVAYTSLARLASAAGDGDAAFAAAQKVVAQSLVPRLRSFVPALVAYAAAGEVGLRVRERMSQHIHVVIARLIRNLNALHLKELSSEHRLKCW